MMCKNILILLSLAMFSCSVDNGVTPEKQQSDDIFQFGTKQTFLDKSYVGNLTYEELAKMGDFGLGTFNLVDGEMACINSNFVRIPVSGEAHIADPSMETFFAVVKFFNADRKSEKINGLDVTGIKTYLNDMISDTSKPIAIKISGKFKTAKTRSIHKQSEPYQSLEEIVADQVTFDLENVEGSIVGFWFPKYMDGVNFPGFHFHFLTDDLKHGGHLLECEIDEAVAEIDFSDKFILQ